MYSYYFISKTNTDQPPAKSFFGDVIQTKSFTDQPTDIHEQEANAIAEQVMQSETTSLNNNAFFKPSLSSIQKKDEEGHTHNSLVQVKSNIVSSAGKPLNNADRQFFESRMNFDFSKVRIHDSTDANTSAKNINALAYTHENDIVFANNQYNPNTSEGKKLLAHELTHVKQQNGTKGTVQAKRELDAATEKEQYAKCLSAIDNVIKKLEANAEKQGMPDDIKEATKLLRKKFTESKIKCYYLDGRVHGITNFTTGEIYMDAKTLQDAPDTFANIGEGNLLHEGIHALHNEKFPVSTKKYGKALDDKAAGKASNLSDAETKELQKLDAWTEYWAYRKMREYNNVVYAQGKDDDTIHNETLKRMREEGGIAPLNVVWAFDPKWDPRKWKPKN